MLQLIERIHSLLHRIDDIIEAMDFCTTVFKRKQLFSIGYAMDSQKRTPSFYDLLHQARQTSYVCIKSCTGYSLVSNGPYP